MESEISFLNGILTRLLKAENDLEGYSFGDDPETGPICEYADDDITDMINKRIKLLKKSK